MFRSGSKPIPPPSMASDSGKSKSTLNKLSNVVASVTGLRISKSNSSSSSGSSNPSGRPISSSGNPESGVDDQPMYSMGFVRSAATSLNQQSSTGSSASSSTPSTTSASGSATASSSSTSGVATSAAASLGASANSKVSVPVLSTTSAAEDDEKESSTLSEQSIHTSPKLGLSRSGTYSASQYLAKKAELARSKSPSPAPQASAPSAHLPTSSGSSLAVPLRNYNPISPPNASPASSNENLLFSDSLQSHLFQAIEDADREHLRILLIPPGGGGGSTMDVLKLRYRMYPYLNPHPDVSTLVNMILKSVHPNPQDKYRPYEDTEDPMYNDCQLLLGEHVGPLTALQLAIMVNEEEIALDLMDYLKDNIPSVAASIPSSGAIGDGLTGRTNSTSSGTGSFSGSILSPTSVERFEPSMVAYLNAEFGEGNTALHLASFFGMAEIVSKMLSMGASPHVRNRKRCKPVDCADDEETRSLFLNLNVRDVVRLTRGPRNAGTQSETSSTESISSPEQPSPINVVEDEISNAVESTPEQPSAVAQVSSSPLAVNTSTAPLQVTTSPLLAPAVARAPSPIRLGSAAGLPPIGIPDRFQVVSIGAGAPSPGVGGRRSRPNSVVGLSNLPSSSQISLMGKSPPKSMVKPPNRRVKFHEKEVLLDALKSGEKEKALELISRPGTSSSDGKNEAELLTKSFMTAHTARNALHLACAGGDLELVELVFERLGTEMVNHRDRTGNTPLHLAAQYVTGEPGKSIVKRLITAGANPALLNKDEDNCSDVAEDDDVRKILLAEIKDRKAKGLPLDDGWCAEEEDETDEDDEDEEEED